jgi:alpha-tubulin suppressor-like RCC1 family protein
VTAIAAGTVHNLALKSDGTVVAWGCDGGPEFYGCNVPSGLTDVTAIDAGTTTASR